MKSLLVIVLVIFIFNTIKFKQHQSENFFYLKCLIYLFISSIHSTFITVTVPLGAILMSILSIFDVKNRKLKRQMIYMGLFIVLLSLVNYACLAHPVQKAYLHYVTHDLSRIDFYAHHANQESLLLSVTDTESLTDWSEHLLESIPVTHWGTKGVGTSMGYTLKLYSNDTITTLTINPYLNYYSNMTLGKYKFTYHNPELMSFIDSIYSRTPSILTINTSKEASINIENPILLTTLWRYILWNDTSNILYPSEDIFNIPAYLFFDKYLGCRISFSDNFQYASINQERIIELPLYLQDMLSEQFILSQLEPTHQLSTFVPTHTYTLPTSTQNFSILLDPNGLYHGLYLHDFITNDKKLLHSVYSEDASFFLLKHPYILILDEKTPGNHYLMLINQNITGKHRYISKNQVILPHSLAICPQNQKFAYIIDYGDHTSLNLVSDYYRSPQVIANGQITDCLFLDNNLLAFTQQLDGEHLLCVYDLIHKQIIKYILIPGDIILTNARDNKVFFAVQRIDGLTLSEGEFFINSDLKLQKLISQ